MYRMIDGDKSDNIDGVKGFGLKTLLKVCPDLVDRPMSLKEVVDSDKRLSDDLEKLKRNFELMQLSDVVISGNTKSSVLTMLQEDSNSLNKLNLQSMFLEDRMSIAIPNFDVWLRETWTTLNYLGRKVKYKTKEKRREAQLRWQREYYMRNREAILQQAKLRYKLKKEKERQEQLYGEGL